MIYKEIEKEEKSVKNTSKRGLLLQSTKAEFTLRCCQELPTERWRSLHISPLISSSLLAGDCLWEPDMLLLPSHTWKPTLAEWSMCYGWPLDDSGREEERFRHSWMLSECAGSVSYDCRQSYWLDTNSICYSKNKVPILSIYLSSNFKQHLLYCWRCGKQHIDVWLFRMCVDTASMKGNWMVAVHIEDKYNFSSRFRTFTARNWSCRYWCKVFHTSFIVLVEDWAEGSSTGHWVNYCTFIH